MEERDGFKTNIGTILALAGSAVGLGNIWRFPYMVVENGGSAFILLYILIVFLICIPAFMLEFSIGRNSRSNVFGAFKVLAPNTKWSVVGLLGVIATFTIASYYCVIGGWTVAFLYKSFIDAFDGMSANLVSDHFANFVQSPLEGSAWALGFTIISILILISGVSKGIEKYNKILMPMLLGILIIMVINSFFLENCAEGFKFIFVPDFSKITVDVVLSALGQAFFSMSLGLGAIITYGSYARKQDSALKSAISVSIIGIVVSLLASMIIFPAVFAYDIPVTDGANLAYITFPAIFQEMPGGYFFGITFFLLLLVAAITSVISIFEVIIAFLSEEFKIARKYAISIVVVATTITSTMCAFSLTQNSSLVLFGKTIFDLFDFVTASFLLPLGALLISLFCGWFWNKELLKNEISSNGLYNVSYFPYFMFMIRFIVPTVIMVIFLAQLKIF